MNIGEKIIALAKERGITQKYLESQIKSYRGKITEWKNCKSTPTDNEIFIIANCLKTSPAYLNGETELKTPITTSEQEFIKDDFIAFYGRVKQNLDDADILELKTFMRIKAEIKNREKEDIAMILGADREFTYENLVFGGTWDKSILEDWEKASPDGKKLIFLSDGVPDDMRSHCFKLLGTDDPNIVVDESKKAFIENYDSMNKEGQEKIAAYISDLVETGKYKKLDKFGMGNEENSKQA